MKGSYPQRETQANLGFCASPMLGVYESTSHQDFSCIYSIAYLSVGFNSYRVAVEGLRFIPKKAAVQLWQGILEDTKDSDRTYG